MVINCTYIFLMSIQKIRFLPYLIAGVYIFVQVLFTCSLHIFPSRTGLAFYPLSGAFWGIEVLNFNEAKCQSPTIDEFWDLSLNKDPLPPPGCCFLGVSALSSMIRRVTHIKFTFECNVTQDIKVPFLPLHFCPVVPPT